MEGDEGKDHSPKSDKLDRSALPLDINSNVMCHGRDRAGVTHQNRIYLGGLLGLG